MLMFNFDFLFGVVFQCLDETFFGFLSVCDGVTPMAHRRPLVMMLFWAWFGIWVLLLLVDVQVTYSQWFKTL
ncbi:hypothetical protein HanPI659440_Chr03g0095931 [Helianthus annuus]|nr:hypothetical protein HanPI659440_Chr03g0095931 [Helianthus annuus]